MKHFVLPGEPRGDSIQIAGRDFHYLAHVRRLGLGGTFRATDARGRQWRCTVRKVGRQSLELALEQEGQAPAGDGPPITLLQALPKSRKMDLIVRQATEAGVAALLPVVSRRSQVRAAGPAPEADSALAARRERWQRVAREAVQQSGRPQAPLIAAVTTLVEAVEALPPGAGVRMVAHQERVGGATLHQCLAGEVAGVVLAVGPEGGFDGEELDFLRERGFTPVTFGGTVLRTETAALFAVAAVQIVLQERQAWKTSR